MLLQIKYALLQPSPEAFVTFAKTKFDETTGELTDEPTREVISTQLTAFAEFIRQVSVKAPATA